MADFSDVVTELQTINSTLETLVATADPQGAAAAESEREKEAAAARSEEYLQTIAEAVTGGRGAAGGGAGGGGGGGGLAGLLGGGAGAGAGAGLGATLAGAGIGVGAGAAGLGVLLAGGGYLLKQMSEFDADAVVANIETLLSINDLFASPLDALQENGQFMGAMGALGLGLAAFGFGSTVVSVQQAIAKFTGTEDWAQTTYDNVETLLSINDLVGGTLTGALVEGGTFLIAMTALMAGLVAFSAGSAAAGAVQAFNRFINSDGWAQVVHDNVKTLVSIQEIEGYDSFKSDEFKVVMGGLMGGLIRFSIGSAVTGATQAFNRFINSEDWAQTIHDNVKTLVSIQEIEGYDSFDKTGFVKTMSGLMIGLMAFSAGEGVSAITQWISGSIGGEAEGPAGQYTKSWSQTIYDNVKTLVSIMSIENINGDVEAFKTVMAGLATGLFDFAIGQTVTGMASVLEKFTGNFADNVFTDVTKLMSLLEDDNIDVKKSEDFAKILKNIGDALSGFAGASFVGTIKTVAADLLSFLIGTDSPITEIKNLAASAAELTEGATAIGNIGDGLDKMANLQFDGSKVKIKDFAADLVASVPLIETAVMGGKIEKSILEKAKGLWPFGDDVADREFLGLASGNIAFEDAAKNMNMLREALGIPSAADVAGELGKSGAQIQRIQTEVQNASYSANVATSRGVIDNRIINNSPTMANSSQINSGTPKLMGDQIGSLVQAHADVMA